MALNANHEIQRLQQTEDRWADNITAFAGSMRFVRIHLTWFLAWIVANTVLLDAAHRFDPYPFGLLTLIVSLEAIFLSSFVMISQNREAKASEIRSELDYRTNVMAEHEIDLIMRALDRMARQQGVEVDDLMLELGTLRADGPPTSYPDPDHRGSSRPSAPLTKTL
jgi:uncharacterized membrane protein